MVDKMKYGNFTQEEIGDYSKLNIVAVVRQIIFMNKLRNHFGIPITVSNWIRDAITQARLIKEKKSNIFSQHPKGCATDTVSLNHILPNIIIPVALILGAKGIGVYYRNGKVSHYHFDTRTDNISTRGYSLWYVKISVTDKYEYITVASDIRDLADNVYRAKNEVI